ncbi:MAG: carboxypeptidase-like regulatory domain-containing protein [Methanoregulaceae archaeon]|nr:carboxypeptidase-like regulatory domain-containing protein [Methanoregulaceae archaeon]
MRRFEVYLFIALFFAVILTGTACAETVFVQVFETDQTINPIQGALVYANNTLVGKTDDEGTIEVFIPGTEVLPLKVEKFGYESWNGEIGAYDAQFLVELQKAKIALTVQLHDADTMDPVQGVNVTLEGAGSVSSVLSDSNGTADFVVQVRTSYRIDTEAEHYQPVSMAVDVGITDKDVQIMLFRDDRFSIRVIDGESDAPLSGARIFVEGIEKGITDSKGILTLPMQRGKVYLFGVVLEGYQEYNGRQIVESDTAFLTLSLKKSPFTIFVSVYDEDNNPVEGALVLLDGAPEGTTSRYGRAVLTNLTAGSYLLDVRHAGFIPVRKSLNVAVQGEDIVIPLLYQKENITIRTVEISGTPVAGVRISLNGEEAGFSSNEGTLPVMLRVNLPYLITAEKEGYHQVVMEQEISSSNKTTSLVIPMQQNFNWMYLGLAGIGIVAVIGAVLIFRRRAGGRSHGKHGGL